MATLQKLRNAGPLLLIFVGLALLAFVAGDALRIFQTPQGSQSVGSVNNEELSAVDFQQMYEEQSNVYKLVRNGNTLSEYELNRIKDEVWNTYIQYQVIKTEADKLGLTVTAAELIEPCREMPRYKRTAGKTENKNRRRDGIGRQRAVIRLEPAARISKNRPPVATDDFASDIGPKMRSDARLKMQLLFFVVCTDVAHARDIRHPARDALPGAFEKEAEIHAKRTIVKVPASLPEPGRTKGTSTVNSLPGAGSSPMSTTPCAITSGTSFSPIIAASASTGEEAMSA